MRADWYYIEHDETVGPTTLEDVDRQIRRAGQSRLVWTEGMTEWTDAKAVPAVATVPDSSTAVLGYGFRSSGLAGAFGSETSDGLKTLAERID